MSGDKYKVLLVDDSPDDRFFMRMVLERSSKFVIVGELRDGQEAIDYLGRKNAFNDSKAFPFPELVLLDLKMPHKNGFDVLQWIQTQNLENLTVAIMSGSWLSEDIAKSKALGAHAYFKKTSLKTEQKQMIRDIEKLLQERQSNVGCHLDSGSDIQKSG
jgi:CheY-like chemotaxis protein